VEGAGYGWKLQDYLHRGEDQGGHGDAQAAYGKIAVHGKKTS
jgi:hypothetical protein